LLSRAMKSSAACEIDWLTSTRQETYGEEVFPVFFIVSARLQGLDLSRFELRESIGAVFE